MERLSIAKQAFLDPWRENSILYRVPGSSLTPGSSAASAANKPRVAPGNRRGDIPNAVSWLRADDAPASAAQQAAAEARFGANWHGDAPAGGAHELLGTLALNAQGSAAGRGDRYYGRLTSGFSEEEKRQYLLSGGRRRRHAALKHAPTDTLGLGKPLPLTGYKGGPLPTGPTYRTAPANPYPKLALEPPLFGPGSAGFDGSGGGFVPYAKVPKPLPSQLEALGTLGLEARSRAAGRSRGNNNASRGSGRVGSRSSAGLDGRGVGGDGEEEEDLDDAALFAAAVAAAEAQGEGPNTFDPWVSTRWGVRSSKPPTGSGERGGAAPQHEMGSGAGTMLRGGEGCGTFDEGDEGFGL